MDILFLLLCALIFCIFWFASVSIANAMSTRFAMRIKGLLITLSILPPLCLVLTIISFFITFNDLFTVLIIMLPFTPIPAAFASMILYRHYRKHFRWFTLCNMILIPIFTVVFGVLWAMSTGGNNW